MTVSLTALDGSGSTQKKKKKKKRKNNKVHQKTDKNKIESLPLGLTYLIFTVGASKAVLPKRALIRIPYIPLCLKNKH